MGERDPQPTPNQQELDDITLRMAPGTIIFNEEGHPVGVAIADGSLDYVSPKDEEVVVVIRPPERKEK